MNNIPTKETTIPINISIIISNNRSRNSLFPNIKYLIKIEEFILFFPAEFQSEIRTRLGFNCNSNRILNAGTPCSPDLSGYARRLRRVASMYTRVSVCGRPWKLRNRSRRKPKAQKERFLNSRGSIRVNVCRSGIFILR